MVKKAFIVGINYISTGNELQGCINDAENMQKLLTNEGFTVEMCVERAATTAGIKAGLQRLVTGVVPGDVIVFHYSGHGSQLPSSKESDGFEEIICPIDLNWTTRVITDDDLAAIFNTVPNGVNVTVVLDCCHSGSGLDQTISYSPTSFVPARTIAQSGTNRYMAPPADIKTRLEGRQLVNWETKKDINATALLIAGCRSDQTSADAYIDGTWQGAATAALIAAYNANNTLTYRQLITSMNDYMITHGYEQRPVLDGYPGLYDEQWIERWGHNTVTAESPPPVMTDPIAPDVSNSVVEPLVPPLSHGYGGSVILKITTVLGIISMIAFWFLIS